MKSRRYFAILLALVMLVGLLPMGQVAYAAGETWTITVHLNGGTGVASTTVEDGDYWSHTPPTKAGYTFGGWYTDPSLDSYYYWNHGAVHSNLDLYAKWWENITAVSASIMLPVAGQHPDLSVKSTGDSSYTITHLGMSYLDDSYIPYDVDETYTFSAGEKIEISIAVGATDYNNYEVTTSATATINGFDATYSNALGDSNRSKVFRLIYTVPNYIIQVNNGTANSLNGSVWQPVENAKDGTEIQLVADSSSTQIFDNWTFDQSVVHTQSTSAANSTTYITMPAGNLIATANFVDVYNSQPTSGTATVDEDYIVTWSLNKTPTSDKYRLYTVDDEGVRTWKAWVNATSATISGAGKSDGLAETYCVSIDYDGIEYFSDNFSITWSTNILDPSTEYTIIVNDGVAEYQEEPNSYGIRPWVTAERAAVGTEIRLSANENTEKLFSGWTFNQSVTYIHGTSNDEQVTIAMPAGNLIATANYVDVFAAQPQDSVISVGSDYTATWVLTITPTSDNYRLYSVDGEGIRTWKGWVNATSAIISGAGKTEGTTETYCVSIEYRSSLYGDHQYYSDNFTVTWDVFSATTYIVTFDANGHGTAPTAQTVENGNMATMPADPTETGWTFGGWYTEAACTNAFDFSTAITADTTLYAKWTEESVTPVTYTVTVTNDGNGTAVASPTSGVTGTEVTLTATPNSGYKFKEWQVVSGGVTVSGDKFTIGTANIEIKAIFEEESVTPVTYTVTFDANGHGTAPAAQTVEEGKTATKPTDPTETGWTFGGWYQDATCSVAFDFATAITADITLYAKWTEDSVTPPVPTTYTVTFDANGHGTAPTAQTVESGKTATKPADPTASGWTFGGWYSDAECATAFDFSTAITADITLYAKWTEESVTPVTYTVTFEPNGGSAVAAQTVENGKTATKPTDPTKEGFVFDGWYQDATFAAAFDFSTPITADVTIYAKWKEVSEPPIEITYTVVSGGNSTWTKGSSETVTITVKRSEADDTCFSHFTGVLIDGMALAAGDYEAKAGSTVITLKASALEKLGLGDHSVTVNFDDGKAETKMTVAAAPGPADPDVPQTGDNSLMGLWIGMMAVSLLGLVSVATLGRKRRYAPKHLGIR